MRQGAVVCWMAVDLDVAAVVVFLRLFVGCVLFACF